MNIIIVGCGQVGQNLAQQLIEDGNNVTVIDKSYDSVKSLTDKMDAMGIVGNISIVGKIITVFAFMCGSSAISEIIARIKVE